jgi:enamine deaminase RidA (YjgF/YER057c/UK114 family)
MGRTGGLLDAVVFYLDTTRNIRMTIERLRTNARMSLVVKHQGTVYLSGEVANDFAGDVQQQTRETLQNIERLLDQAGTDKTRILSATLYLKDIDADFAGMNQVWDQWLPHGCAPARATVQAKLYDPAVLVEISIIAALPDA